ncbi:MAG: hypothetical protein JW727_04905 [Candidatus Aenigmarchaeota archaeon]|nr:hypothetical protein [Candidatus Aenigmarchaeota archaeon]
MKKLILLFGILLMFGVCYAVECPFGEVNCEGKCGMFVDENNNGICDLSESPEEDLIGEKQSGVVDTLTGNVSGKQTQTRTRGTEYYLISLTLILCALYALTYFLTKKGTLAMVTHRKVWNIILLLSFVVCGLTGMIIAMNLDLGLGISVPFNLSFWHYESGIVMTVVSVFHTLWHTSYYKAIFTGGKKRKQD